MSYRSNNHSKARHLVSLTIAGLFGLVLFLASTSAQLPPPPPAAGWTVDAPSTGAVFSKNAQISCDGDAAASGINFTAGVQVLVNNTWVIQNSVQGISQRQQGVPVWGAVVPPPNGGFAVGKARAFVHPFQFAQQFGTEFQIVN